MYLYEEVHFNIKEGLSKGRAFYNYNHCITTTELYSGEGNDHSRNYYTLASHIDFNSHWQAINIFYDPSEDLWSYLISTSDLYLWLGLDKSN